MAMLNFAFKFFITLCVFLVRVDALKKGSQDDEIMLKCKTPEDEDGYCINMHDCKPLIDIMMEKPILNDSIIFLQRSVCGWINDTPKGCCPFEKNVENDIPRNNDTGEVNLNVRKDHLLPVDCGRGLTRRIIGGERTELDEFPWMVLLEYATPSGPVTSCGGALISQRYVLTAAHCIAKNSLPRSWELSHVILGEYDTDTDPDCVQDGENSELCADPILNVPIEKKIIHEKYKSESNDRRYDIGLLRLSMNVTFTNYIKPICLPSNSTFPLNSIAAGWGKTESKFRSSVKLKIKLPLANQVSCATTYAQTGYTIGNGQVCVGGDKKRDSCRGDSGGPLMSMESIVNGIARWTVVGIVSFGPSDCGLENWPGVYTRTYDFISWIHSNLEP